MPNHRFIVAKLVQERKDTLFSQFSSGGLANKKKMEMWEQIRQEAVAQGAQKLADKSWQYVRDTIWYATRRDTLAKPYRDEQQFSELDRIVLDIVGRDVVPIVYDMNELDREDQLEYREASQEYEEPPKAIKNCQSSPPKAVIIRQSSITSVASCGSTDQVSTGESRTHKKSKSQLDYESAVLDVEIKKVKLELLQEELKGKRLENQKLKCDIHSSYSLNQ